MERRFSSAEQGRVWFLTAVKNRRPIAGQRARLRGWCRRISLRRRVRSMCIYISVVAMLSWPSICWMARRLAPPSRRWVAKEWRRVWGEIVLAMPALSASLLIIVNIIWRVSLLPRRLRKRMRFLAGLHDRTGAIFEVRAYCSHGDVAHRHKALLGALAGDYEVRVVEVEPADFEVYQLGHAEPASVEGLDDGAVAHCLRRIRVDGCYEGVDFVDGEHFGQVEPGARGLQQEGGIGVYVAVVRKESEEGFYAADNASLRARGDAEVMKVGAISAEVADGDLRQGYGKLVEPREEARHIAEICLAGVVAEPALKGQVGFVIL